MQQRIARACGAFCLLWLGACANQSQPAPTLYESLGGDQGVETLVDHFLRELASEPRVRHHFAGIHIAGFRERATEHLCHVTDGPCDYSGRSMFEAHKNLDIKESEFNAVVEAMRDAMNASGIDYRIQNQLLARLVPFQAQIVSSN